MPARNPFFTGREDILATLHSTLKNGAAALTQPPAISGLGGIGKTQTAIEYAHRHRDEYQAVLWASAETEEEIFSGFAALARLLDLPQKDEAEQEQVMLAVKNWLATEENWLLILDNADELSLINRFLPTNLNGHIIYTTRASATGKLARRILVEKFSHEDGAALLLKRAARDSSHNSPEWSHSLALSREVDGLPLALDQAGAYIEENNLSVNKYLEIYYGEGIKLFDRYGSLGDEDHAPVTVTFSLAYEQVLKQHPASADFLRLCSFLSPDDIPEEIFIGNLTMSEGGLITATSSQKDWSEFIGTVCRRSLITYNSQDNSFSIHRVVQSVLQREMNEAELQAKLSEAINLISFVFSKEEPSNWPLHDRLLPHALLCLKHTESLSTFVEDISLLMHRVGSYLHTRGLYKNAESLYVQLIEILEARLNKHHLDTATSLNNLAMIYKEQGRYEEAEPLLNRALQIFEVQLGVDDLDTLAANNNLAIIYRIQGKFPEAEKILINALSIMESKLGSEHSKTSLTLNNLALLYKKQNKFADAEILYRRALKIRESQYGSEHHKTATSLNNLAMLYIEQGKFAEAEPLLVRALQILETQLGADHPDTATSCRNLGLLYQSQNKFTDAESLLKRASSIVEVKLGMDHPDTVSWFNDLLVIYLMQDKLEEAEILFLYLLTSLESQLGMEHPTTISTKKNYQLLRRLQMSDPN